MPALSHSQCSTSAAIVFDRPTGRTARFCLSCQLFIPHGGDSPSPQTPVPPTPAPPPDNDPPSDWFFARSTDEIRFALRSINFIGRMGVPPHSIGNREQVPASTVEPCSGESDSVVPVSDDNPCKNGVCTLFKLSRRPIPLQLSCPWTALWRRNWAGMHTLALTRENSCVEHGRGGTRRLRELQQVPEVADPTARVRRGAGVAEEQGARVLGAPVGHPSHVRAQLSEIQHDHQTLLDRIPSLSDLQSSWLLLLHCASARANHFLRVVPPVLAEFAREHDRSLWRCLCRMLRMGERTLLSEAL